MWSQWPTSHSETLLIRKEGDMLGEEGRRQEREETVLPREKAMKYKPRLKSLCSLVRQKSLGRSINVHSRNFFIDGSPQILVLKPLR